MVINAPCRLTTWPSNLTQLHCRMRGVEANMFWLDEKSHSFMNKCCINKEKYLWSSVTAGKVYFIRL